MRKAFWLAVCVLGGILALLPAAGTRAAVFTVDTTADAPDQLPGDGGCSTSASQCSLRAAVQEANALPGSDTIILPPGTYALTITGVGEDASATGDLDLIGDVTLRGTHPSRPVIDANRIDRGLDIKPGVTVEIDFVVVDNGGRPLSADASGINNQGNLTLRNSIVRGSIAPALPGGRGGGIFNSGVASIEFSEVSGNQAVEGGGIYNSGVMTVTASTVSGNTSTGFFGGGGVYNGGSLEITRSTVSGNSATRPMGGSSWGGGIMNLPDTGTSPTLSITNSTISGNSVDSGDGGGIANIGTTIIPSGYIPAYLTITGSTVASNTAGDSGGGIYAEGSETVGMSVIAGNTPDNCGLGPLTIDGNVISDTSCGTATGNIIGDPLLGPLATNGGPTLTHAPSAGSPAIDALAPAGCPATDQRGVTRPRDGDSNGDARCDVGALEVDLMIPLADFDTDGAIDTVEAACDSIPWDAGSIPERSDGAFSGVDDDGDTQIDEALPPGAENFDCDGDGHKGSAESGTPLCGNGVNDDGVIFGGSDDGVVDDGCAGGPAQVGAFSEAQFNIGLGDQDPCGTNGWPLDFVSGQVPDSTNGITLADLTSFLAPVRYLDKSPGHPDFNSRWDVVPGATIAGSPWIQLNDLTALLAGPTAYPPMLGGARAFNGPPCPWPG